MKKTLQILALILIALLALVLVGPFLIPIPPLTDTQPPHALADPDSQFISVLGLDTHYKIAGDGQPTLILLHGFGASLYSWRGVVPTLATEYTVYSYDRPAFGLTERPTEWDALNPYSRQFAAQQLLTLLDAWDVQQAVLVGNSAGGTVAMEVALLAPERVQALILVSPAVGGGGGPYGQYDWLLKTPQMQRIGPLLVRSIQESGLELLDIAWHDLSKRPADTLALYQKPLSADNWDFALWHYQTASAPSELPKRLTEFNLPILIITGDDDRIVATERSIQLAGQLPGAQLVVLPACGHVPQEECPEIFLAAIFQFLQK